ncbi:MAG TPA: thioredoxin domain-containing protein [Sedimenticola thiotaurini]|uniref:Thioredoxin domain-containing protein n=1 Tax=Sedimenticola thiotaurini TaxID=1543721 RepID=A0A831RP06_9GAMM|nr:thioredoxin domain-containing protein [Sedimenticola thiotaurini]
MSRILLFLLCLAIVPASGAEPVNQLKGHPSPYLAMHGDDPVQWQRWGPEALERARRENKLLYISSGYFACHWCHVMQRESYRDAAVADLLNRFFVPVKVDRELQPALDAHLVGFVERTRGQAGWPLNVFLTPEGYPLVGLTYAPRDRFLQLLQRLQLLWQAKADELKRTAREAAGALGREPPEATPLDRVDGELLQDRLVTAALALGDDLEGGFGRQSRFPMAPQWSVLLQRQQARPNRALGHLIVLTLDQMAGQGMRDHLGGGFFRYTIDPSWQVPHYEKMLYSQALLSRLYLQAAEVLQKPRYREVARDTLDFALGELRGDGGGFIASLSAVDPDNREGGGYLWTEAQLTAVLEGEELEFARRRWRLQGPPNTGDGWLPVDHESLEDLVEGLERPVAELQRLERQVRRKLLQARAPRAHPRDTKQLAAWNGLMLSALVDGAQRLGEPRYRDAARGVRDFLVERLWDGERLYRARDGGRAIGQAALEDYVYVARGLRDWAGYSGSKADRELARQLMKRAWQLFFAADGWRRSDDLLIPGLAPEPALSDGPLPSPAAMLIAMSREEGLGERPRRALEISYRTVLENGIWYATQAEQLIEAAAGGRRQRDAGREVSAAAE